MAELCTVGTGTIWPCYDPCLENEFDFVFLYVHFLLYISVSVVVILDDLDVEDAPPSSKLQESQS